MQMTEDCIWRLCFPSSVSPTSPLGTWMTWENMTWLDSRQSMHVSIAFSPPLHSCQPLLGINLTPEFVNLYFPYAGWDLLFFCWWQQHFELQVAHVAVEGKSHVVLNMHAWLQISLPTRFLSLLHLASQCAFGDGMCRLLVQQSNFLLSLKQQNLMKIMFSCIHFPIWSYPPKIMKKTVFYTAKLYGLTGMPLFLLICTVVVVLIVSG